MAPKLPLCFYRRDDVVQISRELIGKVLCTQLGDEPITAGMIVETEAYCGRNDKACHANNGLRTERTETIYKAGGVAYIYLCYGIHHLFNVVTNKKDKADAVLIRAIQPLRGKKIMQKRRAKNENTPGLTAGPGRFTQALGITTDLNGTDLTGATIWLEDHHNKIREDNITATPRVGVDYAGDHARRPWRFYLENNKWVSQ